MQRYSVVSLIVVFAGTFAMAQPKPSSPRSVAEPRTSQAANAAGLPSEETVSSFLHETFGYDASITWKIAAIQPSAITGLAEVNVVLAKGEGQQASTFYVSEDGKHALVGELIPFGAHPYAPAESELELKTNGISRGPTKAAVTIVEFSDLQCPHCKEAQPAVEKLLAEEPKAHFVFQQFPLPSHNWAFKAASYADCLGRANNAAFWKFVDAVYNDQANITEANADEKLSSLSDAAGVKGSDVQACAAKPETKKRIDDSIALGKAVDVTGTPTVFVNGRKVQNVAGTPHDILKGMVEFAAKEAK